MEDRCSKCVLNGSEAVVCKEMELQNALEELYRSIPVIGKVYKPRQCAWFEAEEETDEEAWKN